MKKFLVDVNMPYYFHLWNNPDFLMQKDIDDDASDDQIWQFAKDNNLTIITKDSDFSNKILLSDPPPKVIHVRLGNLKMNQFYVEFQTKWEQILELNKTHKLITVFTDRMEGFS